jgi:FlaA1/EpsC-like NDP-sugar epimerase
MVDCNECIHINITETEQNLMKRSARHRFGRKQPVYRDGIVPVYRKDNIPNHICKLHSKRVFHYAAHPCLAPLSECNGKDFVLQEGDRDGSNKNHL